MPAASLTALLAAKRGGLLERWDHWVRTELTSPSMPVAELIDSIPVFLDELIAALDTQLTSASQQAANRTTARVHGSERLRVGFDVSTVVREYNLVRRAILELAKEDGLTPTVDEVRAVTDFISDAQAHAVAEYQRQRDEDQMRQAAEHTGFLAHELRNPLSSAVTAFSLLRGQSLADEGKLVQVLERSLRRSVELLDKALLVGRVHGRPTVTREPVDVRMLALEARDEALPDAAHRGVTLDVEEQGELVTEADPRLLRSVLSNLVRNAIKFTRPGTRVVIRAHATEVGTVVEVEDRCGGLAPDTIEKIFDPHVQAGNDRSGFGLGLSIAKQAAEAHGGTLQVHNLDQKGCVFRLELPGK